jgi:hypothetical protein
LACTGSGYEISYGRNAYLDPRWGYYGVGKSCPSAEGSLVTVTGKLEAREVEGRERLLLALEGLEEAENMDDLLKLAEREYGGLVDELEARITLRGSRLKLERDPQWVVMWVPAEEYFVVLTATADPMYAAGMEFIIDGHSRQIKAVYANEWFKGE